MKKTLAILLALVMILSLATTAFAASITVVPPTVPEGAVAENITYTAYKIFDASITYKDDGTTIDKISYTIDSTNPFFATIQNATNYFTLNQQGTSSTYNVEVKEAFNDDAAKAFAVTLAAVENKGTGTNLTKDETTGNYTAPGLDEGYYLVTNASSRPMILQTLGEVTVQPKYEYPTQDKQVIDPASGTASDTYVTADLGSTVTFTIKVTIPENATGNIVVHDKMTELEYVGLASDSFAVTVKTTGDEVTNCAKECVVHFEISADQVAANLGKDVTIKYTANVLADIAENDCWTQNSEYTTTPDHVEVYNTKIVVKKTDSAGTALAGAEFVLYKTVDEATKYYKYDATDKTVTWVDSQADATVIAPVIAEGATEATATIEGLANGTYQLLETKAPEGYNKLTAPVEIKINTTSTSTKTEGDDAVEIEYIPETTKVVENKSGTELPTTGGMGTTLFYIFGSLMVVGAAILLVTKKRMSAAE